MPIVPYSVEPEPEDLHTVRPDEGEFCLPVVVNLVQKRRRDSFWEGNHEVETLCGLTRMSPQLEKELPKQMVI